MSLLIDAQHLWFRYRQPWVLQDVSFQITSGAPVALIGANGAGKTTLFSLLCGYLHVQKGSLQIAGMTPAHAIAQGLLGALPQDAQFDADFAIGQQLAFYARLQGMSGQASMAEAARVLGLVDLSDKARDPIAALSHGMRKRLAIAQALIGAPALVLLDEPTAGLDPVNAKQIRDIIAALSTSVTFVISSHNIFELERLCARVLHLAQGKLQPGFSPDHDRSMDTCGADRQLTLQLLLPCQQVLPLLAQLPGVHKVQPATLLNSGLDVIIHYDASLNPTLDVTILQLLHEQRVRYRQLQCGMSLEQQLFADS